MFILRFIGRILSIGLILFIMFIVSGKSAEAFGMRALSAAAVQDSTGHEVQGFAVLLRPSRRPR